MRVISDPLRGAALTEAFLDNTAPEAWYPRKSLADNAREVAAEFGGTKWLARLSDAFGLDPQAPARERLERASRSGVVVTTGQQPGLFGGPVYTLSKALTALALADELEARTGLPVAPVFWAATDDADYNESSSIVIPSSDGALELRVEKRDDVQRPLANEPLPDMHHALDEFLRGVGSGSNAAIVDLVRSAYAGKGTVGSAYIALLRGILEPLGISVLDAAHQSVRIAGHELLLSALAMSDSVTDSLSTRNSAIKQAGFRVQVKEVKGRALVFRYSDTGKERIRAESELNEIQPGELSATVLLRPIMERAILPTAAYVAGPAEIAYFAQVSAVADALGAKQPNVVPRWSGTVIEPRVDRILERYKLEPKDFADPHALEGQKARDSIPAGLQTLMKKISDATGALNETAASGGLVTETVLTGVQRDIAHRLERLERRVAAAVKRQGTQELRDIQAARASLYPLGKAQERAVSFVALLARYGSELQSRMLAAARTHIAGLP